MEAKLVAGRSLILDRYSFSGVAYSAAKGLSLEWCKAPDSGLLKPDIVVFIDVPAEGSAARDGFGQERYEKHDFQIKVRTCFDALMDDSWIVHNTLPFYFLLLARLSMVKEQLKWSLNESREPSRNASLNSWRNLESLLSLSAGIEIKK